MLFFNLAAVPCISHGIGGIWTDRFKWGWGKGGIRLKIAVCEDDQEQLKGMLSLLHSYLAARPLLDGQVIPFTRGQALLDAAVSGGGFDLYLLDIIMPGLNGIETGLRLRELGDGGEIVYLSSSDEYAVDSYNVRAFFYLLKPVEEARLYAILDRAVAQLQRRRQGAVLVRTRNGSRRILLERILYVELVGRAMRYYCTDGPVDSPSLRMSFQKAAAPLLSDPRFHLCGASFVFNLQHVAGVTGQTVQLDNGSCVSIPHAASAPFKRAWGRFWLEEGSEWSQ